MHRIEGTDVVLRKFEPEDAAALWTFRNDPNITSTLGGFSTGYSLRDMEDWIEYHRGVKSEALFAIADVESNKCIGHVGLYQIDQYSQKAEFAILIGDPESQNKGLGQKITRFMIEYGFQALNLNRIYVSFLQSNERVVQMNLRVGFVHEGVLRQDLWRDGKFVDVGRMSILRDDWLQQRETAS